MPSTISAGTTAGTAIAVAGDTTGNLAFQTNGTTTAMTITTAQNVGIGTTTPTTNLVVGTGSSTASLTVYTGTTQTGGVYFADGTTGADRYRGYIEYLHGSDAMSFGANIDERMHLTSTGLLQFNSGYGSVATAYGCRAWVTFNGTGTPAIRASGNVSSIGDFGTGDYSISFSTNMPDSNYTVVGASVKAGGAPSGDNSAFVVMGESPSVSGTGVGMVTANGATLDRGYVYVAVFR